MPKNEKLGLTDEVLQHEQNFGAFADLPDELLVKIWIDLLPDDILNQTRLNQAHAAFLKDNTLWCYKYVKKARGQVSLCNIP